MIEKYRQYKINGVVTPIRINFNGVIIDRAMRRRIRDGLRDASVKEVANEIVAQTKSEEKPKKKGKTSKAKKEVIKPDTEKSEADS